MSYTDGLRRQVSRVEIEIRADSAFEADIPASARGVEIASHQVVTHAYLRQLLLRRETLSPAAEEYETQDLQELVLMGR